MLIYRQSPIQFLLIGPGEKTSQIKFRSEKVSVSLLARATHSEIYQPIFYHYYHLESRTIVVKEDKRLASLNLYWCGPLKFSFAQLQKTFDLYVVDLYNALSDNDLDRTEMMFAPLLYQCSKFGY